MFRPERLLSATLLFPAVKHSLPRRKTGLMVKLLANQFEGGALNSAMNGNGNENDLPRARSQRTNCKHTPAQLYDRATWRGNWVWWRDVTHRKWRGKRAYRHLHTLISERSPFQKQPIVDELEITRYVFHTPIGQFILNECGHFVNTKDSSPIRESFFLFRIVICITETVQYDYLSFIVISTSTHLHAVCCWRDLLSSAVRTVLAEGYTGSSWRAVAGDLNGRLFACSVRPLS